MIFVLKGERIYIPQENFDVDDETFPRVSKYNMSNILITSSNMMFAMTINYTEKSHHYLDVIYLLLLTCVF